MKLSCPSCGAKYSIADEKVQDRLAKIRCRKCSATIIIDGKLDPPNVYTSDGQPSAQPAAATGGADSGGAPEVGPGEYAVDFGDNDQRTMTVQQIVDGYNSGQLSADMYVWTDGMGDWAPLGEVPEINDALHAAAAAPAAAPPEPEPPAAKSFPSDPPRVAVAARSGSGRGSAHDLFGSIETAGSEEDVTTGAAPPVAPAMPTATGARNESSVLFSLSALTASAGPAGGGASASAASPSSGSDADDDDSGLIDLKALTSATGNEQPSGPLGVAAAPLGMAAPLGGITAAAAPTVTDYDLAARPSSNKTGMFLGLGAFAGAVVIGLAIVFSGSDKEKDEAAAAASAPAVARTATPEAEPTAEEKKEEVTAKPPATGTATPEEEEEAKKKEEAEKAAATKTASTRRKWRPRQTTKSTSTKSTSDDSDTTASKTSSGSTSSGSTTTTKKKRKRKKKKESSCNCAPSDLMCAMKCAAG